MLKIKISSKWPLTVPDIRVNNPNIRVNNPDIRVTNPNIRVNKPHIWMYNAKILII